MEGGSTEKPEEHAARTSPISGIGHAGVQRIIRSELLNRQSAFNIHRSFFLTLPTALGTAGPGTAGPGAQNSAEESARYHWWATDVGGAAN